MPEQGNYVDAAYMKNLQKTWVAAETKSKMQSRTLKRKDFNKLRPLQRGEYVRSGGKVTD